METVFGDLAVPDSLRGICDGVDVVIHCASHIGGDEQTSTAVNDHGTRALVEEAVRAGVRRVVYVSTASVYGRGPFREALPGQPPIAPVSVTSRTRAAAERHVLDAGGTVLRPHLVYGTGDRWVVPGLVGLVRRLAAELTCTSLHSMIDVESLARATLAAALSPKDPAGVHHVNHPTPVSSTELLATVADCLDLPPTDAKADVATARALLAGSPRALHHLDMLALDHWFADDAFWRDVGCDPGSGFATEFPRHASWYHQVADLGLKA